MNPGTLWNRRFIPVHQYDEWQVVIDEILDKGLPPALERKIARDAYDWPQVARRFLAVYEDLCADYFGDSYA